MIKDKPISILIDSGVRLSYVSLIIVKLYKLQHDKYEKSWVVQLATHTKGKVNIYVKKCEFIMN